MSLFGSTPPDDSPSMNSSFARSRHGLFEADQAANADSLFDNDDLGERSGSPWDTPPPRKEKSRTDALRTLLPTSDVPDEYIDAFIAALDKDHDGRNQVSGKTVQDILTASKIDSRKQQDIIDIVIPAGSSEDFTLRQNEFNVFLALVGLAQEGETVSIDSVDERRKNLPRPSIVVPSPTDARQRNVTLAEAPSQVFDSPNIKSQPSLKQSPLGNKVLGYTSDDPWSAPELHRNHRHFEDSVREDNNAHGEGVNNSDVNGSSASYIDTSRRQIEPGNTGSRIAAARSVPSGETPEAAPAVVDRPTHESDWVTAAARRGENLHGNDITEPVSGGHGADRHLDPSGGPALYTSRTIGSGRTGNAIEEKITVALMPEKEGIFMFQHHNYEVSSSRRGSKVVRRYSDFVWLLECLYKRYPFRVLPLLPPKRVAVNGNHLSNDGAFIEKRRRGLARFLNALTRHPVLSSEQLVVMFLTVPTELSVWRKQATISVQDEFAGRPLPPGLEESLSPQLKDLFDRTRAAVRRSADLYITLCNIMDRLVKRSEGIANDHARMAVSLQSLTEVSADTYATDTNDVPLLNDGLLTTSKHLRTSQTLKEDEAKAWDEGVLEDLKRQRDALVGLRELFDRRERYDRDNIPFLERRIQTNESKLAMLRSKPEGLLKPGEIEKVVDAIIKDKESIVTQHNRSVFVKECIRDELIYFQSTQYHVSRWNQDWAQERVKYSELQAENWRRLLDGLDGMPLGD